MEAQLDIANNLSTYVENSAILADLKAKIKYLDNKLETLDTNIKLCEMIDSPLTANRLAEQYNELNLKRICLNLKANLVEQELLLFELEAATRD